MSEAEDARWMSRALKLAEEAQGLASPNPTVGCVLVRAFTPPGAGQRDSVVVGEGAHSFDQRDHAEIAALKDAAARTHNVRGATAYVTLEPCAHHGRTGPCADALMAAGIARCVVATVDPNPLVRGKGLARLEGAGIAVQVLVPEAPLAMAARRLNDAFAFAIQHGRPMVTLKAAVSLDGRLAPSLEQRASAIGGGGAAAGWLASAQPVWLTGAAAREDVQRLRHASDAIFTGVGTVLADNPSLTDRSGLKRRRRLLRVVLDGELRTPLDAAIAASSERDLLLVCRENAAMDRETALRAQGAEVLRLPSQAGEVDLAAVLDLLHLRGIRGVLTEAGSALNGSLLRKEVVDRVVMYIAPRKLGEHAIPFAAWTDSPARLLERLSGVDRKGFPNGEGEDVRVSGYLHDPWGGVK